MGQEISKKINLDGLEFKVIDVPSWSSFRPMVAKRDGMEFLKKKDSNLVYIKIEGGYVCVDCNSEILGGTIAHPIHDGPFPLSGSGKCHYEKEPYCPSCETEPNCSGMSIDIPFEQSQMYEMMVKRA